MPDLERDEILPRALLPKGLSGNQYYNEFDVDRVDVSKLAEVISESTLLFLFFCSLESSYTVGYIFFKVIV